MTDEERGPIDELTEEIIDQIGQFVIAHGEDTKTVLHALMKAVFVVLDNAPLGDKEPSVTKLAMNWRRRSKSSLRPTLDGAALRILSSSASFRTTYRPDLTRRAFSL